MSLYGDKTNAKGLLGACVYPSTALKEKGNDAFRKGDYSTAAQRYTDGLQKLKDMPELYTNRAQVSVGVSCRCADQNRALSVLLVAQGPKRMVLLPV